jgi:hypothetical protein
MRTFTKNLFGYLRNALQEIGPYLSLFLMPGGSLIVLTLIAARARLPFMVRP